MAKSVTDRRNLELLRAQLDNERSTFIAHWRDLGEFILPRRPRFFVTDANRGDRRNHRIIDSTATLAARTLRSGMMGGVTSPSRPWFRLSTADPELDKSGNVKRWLSEVSKRMGTVFLKSNLYNVLPIVYGDMGTFGTAAMLMEEDFNNVVHFRAFPIGSYMISKNYDDRVQTFYREFVMTGRQVVEEFGMDDSGKIDWTNISKNVKELWTNNLKEQWVYIKHVIQPNPNWDPDRLEAKFKKFVSTYYEDGMIRQPLGQGLGNILSNDEDPRKLLRESGFNYFPVLVPRWEITGEDMYGTECPGMIALGDIKALQVMQKRKAQAIEKKVNPPMVGPVSLKQSKASLLPGDITYVDDQSGRQGFRPAHEVNFQIGELAQDIQEHQKRISRAFFEDLFLMLAQSDRRQITAREIEERHEEKLLALGPVLEQLNQDLLDPLIDNTFQIMLDQGQIPEPPPELEGVDLKVEYISVMAQAQKSIGISSVERFVGFVGQVAQFNPDALDVLRTDETLLAHAEMLGIDPELVSTEEETSAKRQARAQQQAQAQQMEQVKQAASAAKDLSQAEVGGDNALGAILSGGPG